jgi:hypothetical protein
MITKTEFWKIVRKELKHKHRENKTAEEVMRLIKDIPQNENKESEA